MSIDTDIFHREGITAETDEQARRAVKAFRALQPTLTSYARILTKKSDVRVEMAPRDNGSTDGKRIFYRPPLALGSPVAHDRRLCDKRTDTMHPACPACAIRESVLVTIYHEIAHICFDSFAPVSEEDKVDLLNRALKEVGTEYADKVRRRIQNAPPSFKESYIGIAHLINEFLPVIVNALEDARVNRALFDARKGTRAMFYAEMWNTFTKGVEQKDEYGNTIVKMWNTYPRNMQVMVGLFCKGSGYDYKDWFIPPVVEALNDGQITDLVARLDTIRSAAEVYQLSFPILARLRELGFCQTEKDPIAKEEDSDESEEEPESSDDGTREGEGDPGEGEGEGSSPEGSSNDETSSDGSPDSSEVSGGDSDESEPEAEEAEVDEGDKDDSSGSPQVSDNGEPDDSGDQQSDDGDLDPEGNEDNSSGESGQPGDPDESESPGAASGSSESDAASESSDNGSRSNESGQESDLDRESTSSDEQGGDEVRDESSSKSSESHLSEDDGRDQERPDVEESDELIDTGADEGEGGTEVIENSEYDDVPLGDPEDAATGLQVWLGHDKPKSVEESLGEDAVDRAIVQGIYFETPSREIFGVREHRYGQPIYVGRQNMSSAWEDNSLYRGFTRRAIGADASLQTSEQILGSALLRMRVAFSDNYRGVDMRHKKSGKVDSRVLGKRAFHKDERLFKKRILPGKRDYFVLIGMDVSGSTLGLNLALEKKAVAAQATLLSRMGIPFAIYAHSGNYHDPDAPTRRAGLDLDIYIIKEEHETWEPKVQERLSRLGPDACNLDGHSLEYYRKVMDRSKATDRVILYYSDGKMPAENYHEELEILQREIKICSQKNYTLLGVGIRTDSPARHGLDTVQVDEDADVIKVIKHLEKRLLR